jgi:prevent-host-death family protein
MSIGIDQTGQTSHNRDMSSVITAADAKSGLSDLLRRAELGEEFIVTRNGDPVAKIGPLRNRVGGFFHGEVVVSDPNWWEASDELVELFGA